MRQCFVRVWAAHELEPASEQQELLEPVALDRDLFGGRDASISRAANAPRLTALGADCARLEVPERCATSVVVVPGFDFLDLQQGVPPSEPRFRVGPGHLSSRFGLVIGSNSSVYLVRSLQFQEEGPIDHLVSLPRAHRVQQGNSLTIQAPSILVVGAGAVELLAGETVLPDSRAQVFDRPVSFRIPNAGVSMAGARALDQVPNPELPSTARIGERDEPLDSTELENIAEFVLGKLKRHYAFVPVQIEEREARLLLCYEREDGSTRTLLSGRHVDAWLKHIDRVLSAADFPSIAPPPEPAAWLDAPSPQGESDDPRPDGSYQSIAPAFSADNLRTPVVFGRIRTLSAAFADALIQAEHAAHSNLGVLILGETGTGKEHLARAIHEASARAKGPFVAVNCSSVPDGLIESDLFGHQKGAFSGTQGTRDGLIVSADGGTLFLDEIGDAPLRIQNALLRVLDDHRVRPVGADKERPVDVRVIAATSRDVERLRREGTLRDDLYFRLAEQPITIPPLRERLCDMRTLAVSILEGEDSSKGLSPQALSKLQRYHWPGNIRELRNALRRAVVIGRDLDVLEPHCFPDLQTKEVVLGEDAAPFDFPDLVRGVAMLAWKEHDLNVAAVKSSHGMRALQRAALLYLRTVHGLRAFPPPLVSDWTRLFGAKWSTSENGRGLKEVLRALGVPVTDRRAAEWVIRAAKG